MAIEEDFSEWEIASDKKMLSYGVGYVIINYFLYGGFALVFYFYEVEIGLAVTMLMAAYIIFALWNMVNDPLLGYLTEKPFKWTKKYGFRAPWVVLSAVPILVFYFLIWTPPTGASAIVIFIWFIVITCLFDTFFSIFNDHVYGGYTNQFPTEYERRRSFAMTTLLMGFGVTGLGIVSNLLIVYGDPSSFVRFAMIVVIIMVVLIVIIMLGIKESEEMKQMFIESVEKAETTGFFKTMKTALTTKNFVVSLAGYTVQITAMTLINTSQIYMYKDVYGLDYSFGVIPAIAGLVSFLLFIPFWSNYTRKHGFKQTYWLCFVLHGLSLIPFLFIVDYIYIIIFGFISGIFYSGEVTMLMPVASDTYDLVSSKMERRVDATLVGIRTFFFRVAFIIVAVAIGVTHIITFYDPYTTVLQDQTLLATWGVRVHAYLIPIIMYIIMGFIFRKFYTLEGSEKEALVRKLKDLGIYK